MIRCDTAALRVCTLHVGRSQPLLDLVHGVKREVLQVCRLTYTPAARGTYPAVCERERQEQVQGEALHGCNAEHRIGQGEALQGSISLSFTAEALQQNAVPLVPRIAESKLTMVPVIPSAGTSRCTPTIPAPVIGHPAHKETSFILLLPAAFTEKNTWRTHRM